jgi:peptidoglycan hydrolase CwlO-like protein
MSQVTLGQVFRYFAPTGTALIALLGFFWFVAKPHAEDFVKQTVNSEKFASQRSLDAIDLRTTKTESEIQAIRNILNDVQRQQDVMSTQIETTGDLQKEARDDIRDILKGIKRLEQ